MLRQFIDRCFHKYPQFHLDTISSKYRQHSTAVKPSRHGKWCKYHQTDTHDTNECKALLKLAGRGSDMAMGSNYQIQRAKGSKGKGYRTQQARGRGYGGSKGSRNSGKGKGKGKGRESSSSSSFTGECSYCGKRGHQSRDCRLRLQHEKDAKPKTQNATAVEHNASTVTSDSGIKVQFGQFVTTMKRPSTCVSIGSSDDDVSDHEDDVDSTAAAAAHSPSSPFSLQGSSSAPTCDPYITYDRQGRNYYAAYAQ